MGKRFRALLSRGSTSFQKYDELSAAALTGIRLGAIVWTRRIQAKAGRLASP